MFTMTEEKLQDQLTKVRRGRRGEKRRDGVIEEEGREEKRWSYRREEKRSEGDDRITEEMR